MTTEAVVREHVESMKIPDSTGRDILDAVAVVEGYLKNQAEIARINTEADAAETGVKAQIKLLDQEIYRRQRELDDEKSRSNKVLNDLLTSVQNTRKHTLEPLYEQANHVQHIITLLRLAETIQPVHEINYDEVKPYHEKYFEWIEYIYNDEFLKIRLLITRNDKPKNKYSLIAYGRDAFRGTKLLDNKGIYSYGIHLNDSFGDHSVRVELDSFPEIADAKAYAKKYANKKLKRFITDFEALKKEYQQVTGIYKLSDFEQITAQEKAKEGSK